MTETFLLQRSELLSHARRRRGAASEGSARSPGNGSGPDPDAQGPGLGSQLPLHSGLDFAPLVGRLHHDDEEHEHDPRAAAVAVIIQGRHSLQF